MSRVAVESRAAADGSMRRSRERAISIGLDWVGTTASWDEGSGSELGDSLLSSTGGSARRQEDASEESQDDDEWEMAGRSGTVLALCFFAIGLSAFPSTETLLLQTSLFVKCVDWPQYYGLATMTLFVPGLVVQVLQNRYDQGCNLRFGLRPAMIVRLLLGHSMQLAALFVFFLKLRQEDPDGDGVYDSEVEGKQMLLVVCFVTIGTGCAFVYGSCAQLVAQFPSSHHAFFFIGTYSVSVMLSPVNYFIGALYGLDAITMECNVIHWERLALYYSIGACCNIAGIVAFVVLCFCTVVGRRTMYIIEKKRQRDLVEELLVTAGAGGTEAGVRLERTVSAPLSDVWRRCCTIGCTMVLALAQNMIVCNLYNDLPVAGEINSLPTVMMYSFYAAQCVGSATVMNSTVSRLLTTPVLFCMALLRTPGIAMIIWYTSQSPSAVANGTAAFASDWAIFVFFSLYMWLGGVIFSQSFSVATSLFERPEERALGASVMNVLYFSAVCAVSGGILLQTEWRARAAAAVVTTGAAGAEDGDCVQQRRMLEELLLLGVGSGGGGDSTAAVSIGNLTDCVGGGT
jgi:hypothetical protein